MFRWIEKEKEREREKMREKTRGREKEEKNFSVAHQNNKRILNFVVYLLNLLVCSRGLHVNDNYKIIMHKGYLCSSCKVPHYC